MGRRAWTILTGTLVVIALVLMLLTAFTALEALTWDGRVGSLSGTLDEAYGDTRDARLSRTAEEGPYDPPVLDIGSLADARSLAVEYALPLWGLYGCEGMDQSSICGDLHSAVSYSWQVGFPHHACVKPIALDLTLGRDPNPWPADVERVAHHTTWIWRVGVVIFGVLAVGVSLGALGAWRVRPSIIAREAARAAERRARDDARQAAIVAEGIRQAAASSPGVAFQPGTRTIVLTDEEYAQIKAVRDRERVDGSVVRPRSRATSQSGTHGADDG